MIVVTNKKIKRGKGTKIIRCKACKSKILINFDDLQECTGNFVGYEITCPVCEEKRWLNIFTGNVLNGKIF